MGDADLTIAEAIDALRPFASKVPTDALDYVRAHWDEAEPVFLAEIAKKLETPAEADDDALFLYAIHLCTEMRCAKAFPFFVRIARLPNLLLDNVMGDILTETFPQMLTRTCNGRVSDIKALVEDPTLNDYSRGSALHALMGLVADEELDQAALSGYCLELLSDRLERRASNAWDTAIDVACELRTPGALPLIKAAYERRLANPQMADLDYAVGKFNRSQDVTLERIRKEVRPFRSTEAEMSFFVGGWGRDADDGDDLELLSVLDEREKTFRSPREPGPRVGRNAPCPCGSGKKYKKCCLDRQQAVASAAVVSARGNPIRDEHVPANDWMEAGYRYMEKSTSWQAYRCWQNCWDELTCILPASLLNPGDAEEQGAFEGYDFLANWLQDFEFLLIELATDNLRTAKSGVEYFEEVLGCFPDLHPGIEQNMQADRARCLAMSGESEAAITILEGMIEKHPENAKGYVELADHYCFDANRFNRRRDFEKARQYLQHALEQAEDCPDYDVALRLEDLETMEASMGRPLL